MDVRPRPKHRVSEFKAREWQDVEDSVSEAASPSWKYRVERPWRARQDSPLASCIAICRKESWRVSWSRWDWCLHVTPEQRETWLPQTNEGSLTPANDPRHRKLRLAWQKPHAVNVTERHTRCREVRRSLHSADFVFQQSQQCTKTTNQSLWRIL